MSDTSLAKRDITALIDSNAFKTELARALPNTLKPDRMVRLALTMLKKNSALLACDPTSVMACVVETAQLGLEPEGVLGHAYLVPFGGVCTLIVGYRGFMHLMYQGGAYQQIGAEIVRLKDKFGRTLGTRRELIHEPAAIPKEDGPEHWRGAYAYTVNLTGHYHFHYMEREEIEKARNRSKSWQKFKKEGKATPWQTDAEEMYKKTPIRRIAKYSQTSTTDKRDVLLRAVMLDEYGERKGLLIPTLSGFEVNPEPPEADDPNPVAPTTEIATLAPTGSSSSASANTATSSRKPARSAGKRTAKSTPPDNGLVPKARIPNTPIDVAPEDDPFISSREQTDLYNKAQQNNWEIPDEVVKYLKKRFKCDSVRLVRRSWLPEIHKTLESGT
jgi:recombination protein RecT